MQTPTTPEMRPYRVTATTPGGGCTLIADCDTLADARAFAAKERATPQVLSPLVVRIIERERDGDSCIAAWSNRTGRWIPVRSERR